MRKKYATLSEKIYDELFDDITSQRLVCGQKLTLKMLKDRFDVSHTPIREALTRLSENGLITYYSNCGVKVTTFTDEDICQIFQFIGELDALAISFCKSSYNHVPLVVELEEIINKGDEALSENNLPQWKLYSEKFHTIFYRYAQNEYLQEAANRLHAKIEVLSTMYYIPDNVEHINESHREIFKEIQKDDFDSAGELMRRHLQIDMVYALKAYAEYQEKISDPD